MRAHDALAVLRNAAKDLCTCGKEQNPGQRRHRYLCPTRKALARINQLGILFRPGAR